MIRSRSEARGRSRCGCDVHGFVWSVVASPSSRGIAREADRAASRSRRARELARAGRPPRADLPSRTGPVRRTFGLAPHSRETFAPGPFTQNRVAARHEAVAFAIGQWERSPARASTGTNAPESLSRVRRRADHRTKPRTIRGRSPPNPIDRRRVRPRAARRRAIRRHVARPSPTSGYSLRPI